jgi:hypothetical protein
VCRKILATTSPVLSSGVQKNSGDDLASVERDGDRYGRPSISGKSKELV